MEGFSDEEFDSPPSPPILTRRAVGARYVFDAMKLRDPAIRGFAIGIASHGIGTARAFQVNEQSGAFAALAMGMNGALTALLVPWLLSSF